MKVQEPSAGGLAGLRDRFIDRFAPDFRDVALYPLVILTLLNFVDEFDQAAFAILGPEIQDAFGLSDTGIGAIRAVSLGLVWIVVPFLGFLGDRYSRVKISIIGAITWGVASLATGLVPATMIWLLTLVRFTAGAGQTVNGPIHWSLLADYHPPQVRGRAYSIHRSALAWGSIVGPGLAGLIAWQLGWRWAFILLALPTFVVVLVAFRLRDPVRGITDNKDAALEAAKEDPVPFDRAVRWLYSVPTLKRIYIGAVFAGIGWTSFATYAPIFLEREFGLNELERGVITSAGGIFSLAGFMIAGQLTDWLQKHRPLHYLALMYGLSIAVAGFFLVPYAAAPTLWIVIPLGFFVTFFGTFWLPPYLTVIAYASPARIRTLGLSYAGFFFALGTVGVPFVGYISDTFSVRWALGVAAFVAGVSGLVLATCARFVNADVERSFKVLTEEARLRQERLEAGEQSLLVVRDLDVGYDGTQVLFGVNLEVKEGELVALLGTNGAGKSTLLKAVSGLVHPMGGAVFFDAKDIAHLEPEETATLGIIQMPGGKSVFPTLTVKENLEMAAWLYHKDRAHTDEAFRHVMEVFPILGQRMHQQAGSMSGGEQQMLSLAQAFIAKPRLLMIDELSLGLAPKIVQQLLEIVKEIHARGTTIILVEQSVNVALTVAQHCYFMEKGEIRFDGNTTELLERTDILRSVFLEGASAVVGEKGDGKGPAKGKGDGKGSAEGKGKKR